MSEFGPLAQHTRQVKTAEIAIEGLREMRPVIVMKPANEDNPKYFNEVLRRQRRARRGSGRDVTVADLQKGRQDDLELLPRYCAVGFKAGTVLDVDGNEIPFSEEACRALLTLVLEAPGGREVFDQFKEDAAVPATFLETDDESDVETQAGN